MVEGLLLLANFLVHVAFFDSGINDSLLLSGLMSFSILFLYDVFGMRLRSMLSSRNYLSSFKFLFSIFSFSIIFVFYSTILLYFYFYFSSYYDILFSLVFVDEFRTSINNSLSFRDLFYVCKLIIFPSASLACRCTVCYFS